MNNTSTKHSRIIILLLILLIVCSTTAYAKTPSKKDVHKAYVEYINLNYMPYYKTGKRKVEKTPYGLFEYEYLELRAKEIDINKDGVNELIISKYTGGARGACGLFIYRNGEVIDTKTGGTGYALVYKKKVYFSWSNGAADNGFTKVTIKKKSKGIKTIEYEEISNFNGGNVKYKINNRFVSADKYKKSLSLPSNYGARGLNLTDIETYIGKVS